MISRLNYLRWEKSSPNEGERLAVVAIVTIDKKELEKKLAQYSEIGTKYNSHYEVFFKRIEQINKEIGRVRAKKLKLAQSKLQKQLFIEKILKLDATVGGKGFEALKWGWRKYTKLK